MTLHEYITLNPFNTFVIVKPGFIKKSDEIIDIFKANGYTVAKYVGRRLTYDMAADLYKKHKDEEWYDDLCKYMSSGVSIGYCLNYTGKEDPIKKTDSIKDDIRNTYGKDEMRNALHSSDSKENITREANIYFNK